MSNHKKTIRWILYLLIAILLVGYVLFQSKNLILGPILLVDEPQDGATLPYEVFTVKGSAKNIAYIYLNDRQIFVDSEGKFSEKLIAPVGYSIIKLDAQDKFGRKKEKIIRVILKKSINITPIEKLQEPEEASTNLNN